MLKKSASRESDGPVSPLCSRNAHDRNVLVRRAQWGTHPGHPEKTSTSMFGRGIVSYLLRPCLGKGASWRAGVGRVRCLDFLSILPTIQVVRLTCFQTVYRTQIMFLHKRLASQEF